MRKHAYAPISIQNFQLKDYAFEIFKITFFASIIYLFSTFHRNALILTEEGASVAGFRTRRKYVNHHNGSVTVILNMWKRKTCLEQVDLLDEQTYPIDQVIIWQDGTFADCEGVKEKRVHGKKVTLIQSSEPTKWKFLGRFAFIPLLDTDFVVLFDDDVGPRSRWIENCLRVVQEKDSLVTGMGRIVKDVTSYTQEGFGDGGDDVRYDTEVDYGGHTWCFRPQWTRHLWNVDDLFWETGEDIQLSANLWLAEGIRTFVPRQLRIEDSTNDGLRLFWGQASDLNAAFWGHEIERVRSQLIYNLTKKGWILLKDRQLD